MRKTSGPQNGTTNFYVRKQILNKNKSPNGHKTKSRGKLTQQTTISNAMVTRKTNSFSKLQPNQSSTFFTNTTQTNKPRKSQPSFKKIKDLKKYEKQIMQILHQSASIIQRQWRKYLIRKLRKSLQIRNKKQQVIKEIRQKQLDSVSGRTSQNSQMYNNKKYYSPADSEKKKTDNSFNKNIYSFSLVDNRSKGNLSPIKNQNNKIIQHCLIKKAELSHNRTRSDQPIKLLNEKIKSITKIEEKPLQFVPNIISLSIKAQSSPEKKKKKIKSSKSIEQTKYEDHYIKNQKGALDQILKKTEQKLEEKKLKKILALENSFSSNLMTFRSYQKNIESVSQEHNKNLTILMNKKKHLLDKFNEFVEICQKNISQIREEENIVEDQKFNSKKKNQNLNMIDTSFNDDMSGFNSRSIAFQQWDFEGQFSDKKILSQIYKEKDLEILIDQNDHKQMTIINELMQDEKKSDQLTNEIKQNILSHKQINQQSISTPIKQRQQSELQEQDKDSCQKTQLMVQNINEVKKQQDEKKQTNNLFPAPENIKLNEVIKKSVPELPKKEQKKQKRLTEEQIQIQLKKFHPILPTIDIVNNWLLEVSHFILDNFGAEFMRKLINVEQPQSHQLWKHCIKKEPYVKQYVSISQKIFKQFEFFHIKTLITDCNVQNDKKEAYSALMFTFNQALYESLNRMLLDELVQGRNWLKVPWSNQFRVKKLIGPDHSKQALEKAINRVSNISDYNILPLNSHAIPGNQFEQSQHNLIFAEEVKQIPLFCEFQKGFLIYQISKMIEHQLLTQQAKKISIFFS